MNSPLTRTVTQDGRFERSLDKARKMHALGYRAYVLPGRPNCYGVNSSRPGVEPHIVAVTPVGLRCDCESGLAVEPCWHAGLLFLRLRRERKPTQLADPGIHVSHDPDNLDWLEAIPQLPTRAPTPAQPIKRQLRLEDLYE